MKYFSKSSLSAIIPAVMLTAGYIFLTYIYDTPLCIIRAMTGLPCPGCGLTSAGISLLQGRFAAAWNFNAMIYILPIVSAVLLADKKFIRPKYPRFTIYFSLGCSVIMVIYFIIRLCLYFPHGTHPMNISENTLPKKIISRPISDGSKNK